MACAAAEESGNGPGRRPGRCVLRHAQRLLQLRPARPCRSTSRRCRSALPDELAPKIEHFMPVARGRCWGLPSLKIFASARARRTSSPATPRSSRSIDLGVEVMENSELDLSMLYRAAEGRSGPRGHRGRRTWRRSSARATPTRTCCPKLARFELRPGGFYRGEPGLARLRRLRQQVLAGVREGVRVRAVLRQLAAGGARASRSPARWTSTARSASTWPPAASADPGHAARHQQHRPRAT